MDDGCEKHLLWTPATEGSAESNNARLKQNGWSLSGLSGFENRWPRELSGGMRKRVDIGRVYANDPEVLLMDEPFGALDAQTKERMQTDLLDAWRVTRKTVIFVTHDLEEAIFLSDEVIVMSARPGRIRHIEEVQLAPAARGGNALDRRVPEDQAKTVGHARELAEFPIPARSWNEALAPFACFHALPRPARSRPAWKGMAANGTGPLRAFSRTLSGSCSNRVLF